MLVHHHILYGCICQYVSVAFGSLSLNWHPNILGPMHFYSSWCSLWMVIMFDKKCNNITCFDSCYQYKNVANVSL